MQGWLNTTSALGAINLAHVVSVAPTATPGSSRFSLSSGGTVDIHMGATDADAQDALHRLVESVDPADYS